MPPTYQRDTMVCYLDEAEGIERVVYNNEEVWRNETEWGAERAPFSIVK